MKKSLTFMFWIAVYMVGFFAIGGDAKGLREMSRPEMELARGGDNCYSLSYNNCPPGNIATLGCKEANNCDANLNCLIPQDLVLHQAGWNSSVIVVGNESGMTGAQDNEPIACVRSINCTACTYIGVVPFCGQGATIDWELYETPYSLYGNSCTGDGY
jgi:hypothetical protein